MAQQPLMGQSLVITITLCMTPLNARRRDLHLTTQHSQDRDIHAPGGIRTHNPSKKAAGNPRLKPRAHWDRHLCSYLVSALYRDYTCFKLAGALFRREFDLVEGVAAESKGSQTRSANACQVLYRVHKWTYSYIQPASMRKAFESFQRLLPWGRIINGSHLENQ
jgi:hypothetical protein